MGSQLHRTAELHVTGLRAGSAFACAGNDQRSFQLGKTTSTVSMSRPCGVAMTPIEIEASAQCRA
jgi:hypothetical protein